MTRPYVAIVAREQHPEPLHALFVELLAVAHLVAFEPRISSRVRACILASPQLLDRAPVGVPLAVWTDDVDEGNALLGVDGVAAVLSSVPEVVLVAGTRGVPVPAEPDAFFDVRPVAPAVRARIRRARGLPECAFAVIDEVDGGMSWCGDALAREAVDTALACASVAVVRGDSIRRAMAWGAPVVTDESTRALVDAVHGRDVVVEHGDALGAATLLARDEPRAAALSWRARMLYEQRFSTKRAAYELARMLRISPAGPDHVRTAIEELGTPLSAPSVARAYDRCSPFVR